jgi:hypothetical protein
VRANLTDRPPPPTEFADRADRRLDRRESLWRSRQDGDASLFGDLFYELETVAESKR